MLHYMLTWKESGNVNTTDFWFHNRREMFEFMRWIESTGGLMVSYKRMEV